MPLVLNIGIFIIGIISVIIVINMNDIGKNYKVKRVSNDYIELVFYKKVIKINLTDVKAIYPISYSFLKVIKSRRFCIETNKHKYDCYFKTDGDNLVLLYNLYCKELTKESNGLALGRFSHPQKWIEKKSQMKRHIILVYTFCGASRLFCVIAVN